MIFNQFIAGEGESGEGFVVLPVSTTVATGAIASATVSMLGTYTATAEEAITGRTTGYKNDVCLYEDSQGAKHLAAVKTETLPEGAAKNVLVSETPLYLNEDKTEVITESSGLTTYIAATNSLELFTRYGSPTITNETVSNFSASNYIGANIGKNLTNFTMIVRYYTTGTVYNTCIQLGSWHVVRFNGATYVPWNPGETGLSGVAVTKDCWAWSKIVVTDSNISIYWIQDNGYNMDNLPVSGWTTIYSGSSRLDTLKTSNMWFGIDKGATSLYWRGQIDFKSFAIYQNGSIVWRPFLDNSTVTFTGHKYVDEDVGYFNLTTPLIKGPSQLVVHPEDFQESTEEFENFTKVGNPSISNKILSGGSSSNYLSLSSYQGTINSFEFVFCLNGTNTGSEQTFYGTTNTGTGRFKNFQCNIKNDGKLEIAINSSSSWLYFLSSTNTLPSGYFLVKYSWDGSAYKIHFSTDNGSTWNEEGSYTSSTAPASFDTIAFGTGGSSSSYSAFNGSIDLSKTYFKVNGILWWTPYTTEQSITDYKTVGNPTISNKVLSGLSASNYLSKTIIIPENYTSLEILSKGKFSSSVGWQVGIGMTRCQFFKIANYSTLMLSNYRSGDVGSTTLTNNKVYWYRGISDGTNYTLYYKEFVEGETKDNLNFNNFIQVATTPYAAAMIQTGERRLFIGRCAEEQWSSQYWSGNLDLSQTYIKVDGTVLWTPYYTTTAKIGYLSLTKPTASTTSTVLTGIQNPTATYAGSVCTPASLGKKILLDSTLTNIIGSEDI